MSLLFFIALFTSLLALHEKAREHKSKMSLSEYNKFYLEQLRLNSPPKSTEEVLSPSKPLLKWPKFETEEHQAFSEASADGWTVTDFDTELGEVLVTKPAKGCEKDGAELRAKRARIEEKIGLLLPCASHTFLLLKPTFPNRLFLRDGKVISLDENILKIRHEKKFLMVKLGLEGEKPSRILDWNLFGQVACFQLKSSELHGILLVDLRSIRENETIVRAVKTSWGFEALEDVNRVKTLWLEGWQSMPLQVAGDQIALCKRDGDLSTLHYIHLSSLLMSVVPFGKSFRHLVKGGKGKASRYILTKVDFTTQRLLEYEMSCAPFVTPDRRLSVFITSNNRLHFLNPMSPEKPMSYELGTKFDSFVVRLIDFKTYEVFLWNQYKSRYIIFAVRIA